MEDWICIIHLNFYKTVRRFITGIRQKNRQICHENIVNDNNKDF